MFLATHRVRTTRPDKTSFDCYLVLREKGTIKSTVNVHSSNGKTMITMLPRNNTIPGNRGNNNNNNNEIDFRVINIIFIIFAAPNSLGSHSNCVKMQFFLVGYQSQPLITFE